jgi:hypothetical protein
VQVDTVQERAGQARAVAFDDVGLADAVVARVPEIPARAGVHRGDEHETGGEAQRCRGAADGDARLLQRLTQGLDDAPVELGQFIEEEHAVVGQRHFPGPRHPAAADEAGI